MQLTWCHCHPIISRLIKIQNGQLTFPVPAYPIPRLSWKRPLNGCRSMYFLYRFTPVWSWSIKTESSGITRAGLLRARCIFQSSSQYLWDTHRWLQSKDEQLASRNENKLKKPQQLHLPASHTDSTLDNHVTLIFCLEINACQGPNMHISLARLS